jgi:hypothetical protein
MDADPIKIAALSALREPYQLYESISFHLVTDTPGIEPGIKECTSLCYAPCSSVSALIYRIVFLCALEPLSIIPQ